MSTTMAAAVIAAGLMITGCSSQGGSMDEKDAAGLTSAEVESMSLEQQFERYGERYRVSGELLTEAQQQISDENWYWLTNAVMPASGATAHDALDGAQYENSYYIDAGRAIRLPGATGAESDTEPMIDYFASRGWDSEVLDYGDGTFVARAVTDTGYRIDYMVQENGQYNLTVTSGTFWGDYSALLAHISDRVPDAELHEESPPGVLTPFPAWDDPVVAS